MIFPRFASWGRPILLLAVILLLGQSGWLLRAELFSIRLYQRVGSPVATLVVSCRFEPTCSHYALEVLRRDGLLRGNLQLAKRLARCSPGGVLYEWFTASPGESPNGAGSVRDRT